MSGQDVAKAEAQLRQQQASEDARKAYMQQMHLDWWARVAQASRRTIRLLTHPSIPVGSPLVPHHEFRTLLLALYTAAAEYDVPIEEVQKAGAVVYEEKKKGIEEQKKRAEEANRAVKAAEEPKAEVVAP